MSKRLLSGCMCIMCVSDVCVRVYIWIWNATAFSWLWLCWNGSISVYATGRVPACLLPRKHWHFSACYACCCNCLHSHTHMHSLHCIMALCQYCCCCCFDNAQQTQNKQKKKQKNIFCRLLCCNLEPALHIVHHFNVLRFEIRNRMQINCRIAISVRENC